MAAAATGPPGAESPAPRSALPMRILRTLVPGVGRVHDQVGPFAAAWQASNEAALQGEGPLWVALGDSMSQGIGARDIAGGWVSQLHDQLTEAGRELRLVNLSTTGAKVVDVLESQIPRLKEIPVAPALVTVLVGANDMLVRGRRAAAVSSFARLLDLLPAQVCVVATLPRRNPQALAINSLIEQAAGAGHIRVADMRGRTLGSLRGTRAADHFHPNERGYASVAAAFAKALDLPPATG